MKWEMRWKYWMAKTRIPGVWRLRDGGHYVRSRVSDPVTRTRFEVAAVLRDAKTPRDAQRRLDELVDAKRAELRGEIRTKQPWSSFAASLLQERIRRKDIESEATVDRWRDAIKIMLPVFGHMDAPAVQRKHIDHWLNTTVADWMEHGKPVRRKRRRDGKLVVETVHVRPTATTVNGWLRVLKTICGAIKVKFDLAKSAFEGIAFFPEGRVHTRERPNALPPERLAEFMQLARAMFPQHYAMILLGFVTGLRPSSLRPLRRRGPEADIDWETGLLQVRRSHSRGQKIMNATKTKKDTEVALPPDVLAVLEEHVAALDGKQAASDLLFPGDHGKLRTRNVLAKPFAAITKAMSLPYPLTPKGMRRTFQDAARAAAVHDVVTRSISGHSTERMQHHYSTAQAEEQRAALARIHDLTQKGGNKGGKAER